VTNKVDSFVFDAGTKPDLVNFDGRKYLLAEKKENKTLDEYIYQYKYAGNYVDRREAIDFAAKIRMIPRLLVSSILRSRINILGYAITRLVNWISKGCS
jgi:hypothetical protein